MTNDIQAAKRYLEQRNDANDCNLSNLFLVGAKEGAGLGALWMSQEIMHRRTIPHPINPMLSIPDPKLRMHGEDLAGAVWLSMPEKVFATAVTRMVQAPNIRDKVPMLFVYGTKDEISGRTADTIIRDLKKIPA